MHHPEDVTDGKPMTMTPEAWTVIGTGGVILIAIAASNRQLRSEMSELRGEMNGLHDRMNGIQVEIGHLRERMAKLEGLLEGLREAITGRQGT